LRFLLLKKKAQFMTVTRGSLKALIFLVTLFFLSYNEAIGIFFRKQTMKRKLYLLFLTSTLLIIMSCGLFQGKVTIIPKQNALATAVSQTLTAKPLLPTAAGQANVTPTPETSTATLTLTLPPTQTVTSTLETMRTGTPAWKAPMDTGKSFGIDAGGYQDGTIHIYMDSGAMVLSSTSNIGFRSWRLSAPTPQDFYLDATFTTVSCGNSDEYGLVYRAPNYDSGLGYYFGITCGGAYSLYKWTTAGSAVVLKDTTPLIKTGTNQTNRIGIYAKGSAVTFYINDKKLKQYTDPDLTISGHIGTYIGGYSGNFVVKMNEITYWEVH
jgi:hypothetical protein